MNTSQVVSTQQGAALVETGPTSPLGEESGSQQAQRALTTLTLHIDLKPERIQDPALAVVTEEGSAYSLELAIHHTQPVTIELAEPMVSITLHANANLEAVAKAA